jgi:hypothetical protein
MRVRWRISDMGSRRVGLVSGAQSGSAVRSGGDPLDTVHIAPMKYHLFQSAQA